MFHSFNTLSPLDGRYVSKVTELSGYFSESALIRYRVLIEVEWLIHLCNTAKLPNTRKLETKEVRELRKLYRSWDEDGEQAQAVKDIESITNHDVKAVEYFVKENMEKSTMSDLLEMVHFACTSEDINNLSYSLMMRDAMDEVMIPTLEEMVESLRNLATKGRTIPMLSHTHGQPASPTTVGKEVTNVMVRLLMQIEQLKDQPYLGKINGAVGNWNAHIVAYPEVDWIKESRKFIEKLGLIPTLFTTQIEPHDFIAETAHNLVRINNIILDFDRDMWTYIGKNYFGQKLKEGEIGSSTMPHKVNPIDFENSEGNLGLANAMLSHLAEKLPIARMQRDLTDSTVQRNLGVAFGYSLLAYQSSLKGLSKVSINKEILLADLDKHWEVLAEPVQTVMRRYKIPKPYEKLKKLTRGKGLDQKRYQAFVKKLEIPARAKNKLLKLTPATYIGLAKELVTLELDL
ncbi:adenylosuccinate lyase [Candidatus Peregrinibacteria bacterium]|nr:adenylosuccinate lyase [Candidatus Peregrinibacteria bacterium]